MILNGYAILDAFLTLLRLGIGIFVVWLALTGLRSWRQAATHPEIREVIENRGYLLMLLAFLLLGLNVIAWPLLYLLLQSYVKEWPGVMCIYGVTRIGAGSLGVSRFLPGLLTALQVTKPALVFLSGAWFVLYLVNRRTPTAPLTGRTLLLLAAMGLLATGDAVFESVYLFIPKKEEFLSVGCCSMAFDDRGSRWAPSGLLGENAAQTLLGIYYAVNVGMVLALGACVRWQGGRVPRPWLLPLLLGSVLAILINVVFLVEVAAPRFLHLPNHHCPYDLVPRAPQSLVAVALFLAGSFCVGWGCTAGWLGNRGEARTFLPRMVGRLFQFGALAYLASILVMSIELALT